MPLACLLARPQPELAGRTIGVMRQRFPQSSNYARARARPMSLSKCAACTMADLNTNHSAHPQFVVHNSICMRRRRRPHCARALVRLCELACVRTRARTRRLRIYSCVVVFDGETSGCVQQRATAVSRATRKTLCARARPHARLKTIDARREQN